MGNFIMLDDQILMVLSQQKSDILDEKFLTLIE